MLRIEVHSLTLDDKKQGKIYMEVEGSKSGTLSSEIVEAVCPEWDPYFRVDSNSTDRITFQIINLKKEEEEQIGSCEIYCNRFVKENRKKLNWQNPTEYGFDILEGDKVIGTLNVYVWFDSALSFMGQFPQNVNLSLKKRNDPLPIYSVKCPTSNVFSFLDENVEGQYCKFSESIYRDHL